MTHDERRDRNPENLVDQTGSSWELPFYVEDETGRLLVEIDDVTVGEPDRRRVHSREPAHLGRSVHRNRC